MNLSRQTLNELYREFCDLREAAESIRAILLRAGFSAEFLGGPATPELIPEESEAESPEVANDPPRQQTSPTHPKGEPSRNQEVSNRDHHFQRGRRGTSKLSDDEWAEARRLYEEEGLSDAEISKRFGGKIGEGGIYARRRRDEWNPRDDAQAIAEWKAKELRARELYRSGVPVAQIASDFGVSKGTVYNWVRADIYDRQAASENRLARWQQGMGEATGGGEDEKRGPRGEAVDRDPVEGEVLGDDEIDDPDDPSEAFQGGRLFLEEGRGVIPSFEPGSEPGWIKLPHHVEEPDPPPSGGGPAKKSPLRRCWHCQAMTESDPCSVCSRPWHQPGMRMEAA